MTTSAVTAMGSSSGSLSGLADLLANARNSDEFDDIWRQNPEAALDALRDLAERAAADGKLDVLLSLARNLGGIDRLIDKVPGMLERLLEGGWDDAVGTLVALAPFAWVRRQRREKSKIPQWEIDLVRAAVAANALLALQDALAQGVLSEQLFFQMELVRCATLMHHARHADMVDFLIQNGLKASDRDADGRSALQAALADEKASEAALRLAETADFDDALSVDLFEGALDKPETLAAGLSAGARIEAMLPGDKTALRVAVERNHDRSALLLAQAGADPFRADRDGRSAFDAARGAGKKELAVAISKPMAAAEALAADMQRRRNIQLVGLTRR
jgi:hypothetical protein